MQKVEHSRGSSIGIALFLLTAALVLALDQVSKLWIRANLIPGQSLPAEGALRLTYTDNPGGLLGLLVPSSLAPLLAFAIILLAFLLYQRHLRRLSISARIGGAMLIAGGTGNLIDRLYRGNVTDFIDVRLGTILQWPTFNLADVAILAGAALLALYLFARPPRAGQDQPG